MGRLQTGCDNFNITWLEMRELGSVERLYKGKENPFRGGIFPGEKEMQLEGSCWTIEYWRGDMGFCMGALH